MTNGTAAYGMISRLGPASFPVASDWLRAHCQCEECWDAATQQRRELHPATGTTLDEVDQSEPEVVRCQWDDGHRGHLSLMDIGAALAAGIGLDAGVPLGPDGLRRLPWATADSGAVGRHAATEVLLDDAVVHHLLDDLHRHGAVLIDGVGTTTADTGALLERIGPLRRSTFGSLWSFGPDGEHADGAYARHALEPHTDGTYERDPPGIQAFHVLQPAPSGGETLLVDGLAAALALAQVDAFAFELLSLVHLPAAYRGRGVDRRAAHPTLRLRPDPAAEADPTRRPEDLLARLDAMVWNPADRLPHLLADPTEQAALSAALRTLHELVLEPARTLRLNLQPGEVLLIDNHRVLHGRTAFTGDRRVCGAYLDRVTWESRWRATLLT